MAKVFGIPSTELAIGMAGFLVAIFLIITIGAVRRYILVKMGTRNIPRRKGQSLLIVIGLMLSSTIIATSLGIGDTVRYSIRSVALEFLGPTDEIIKGPGKQLVGQEYFDYAEFTKIESLAQQNSDIDALLPLIEISLPAANNDLGLAENKMRVRGIDGGYASKFDDLTTIKGDVVTIDALEINETYINSDASETLKIYKGDKIVVYTRSGETAFIVSEVLEKGGLAGGGRHPYILLNLESLQRLLNKEGKITNILVSNTGGTDESLDRSESVTRFLRSELTNTQVATEIFNILRSSEIPELLLGEARFVQATDPDASELLKRLSKKLDSERFDDEFIEDITDYPTQLTILGILGKSGFHEDAREITILTNSLINLRVDDEKMDSVKLAETVATGVTTIFSIFGSFSIMVGLLLIFLVFVLLAAARATELGMARAVGLKRRDLIQIFTYEGTIYALLSTILGTVFGVALSFGLIVVLKDLIDTDDFVITPYYTITSLVIAFGSGLILTSITVVISAYRTSKLNIVVAIRGLKDEFVKSTPESTRQKVYQLTWNLVFPIKQLVLIVTNKKNRFKNLMLLSVAPIAWPINISISLVKLSGTHTYLILGMLSSALMLQGILSDAGASFFIGLTGIALSVGLFARVVSSKCTNDIETSNQIGGTLEGGLVLLANSLPFDFFERWIGELSEPGPWFWPIGGAISTAAAVWLLMCNTRILIAVLNLMLSRFSGLHAVTRTAISYPMASKFRTGVTIAMFALIIFTLMIFSILNGLQDVTAEQPERVTGGYDIKASISSALPISGDIEHYLDMSEIDVVAGASNIPVEVKEADGINDVYKRSKLVSLENDFFQSTKWRMAHYDPTYGATDREIWRSLIDNPDLVIASASIIPSEDPFGPPDRSFKTSYVESGDLKEIDSFILEMKKRRGSTEPEEVTIIGIVERLASGTGFGEGGTTFYSGRALTSKIADEYIPLDTFYFSLIDENNASEYSQKLENTFLANGMDAENLLEALETERATSNAFNKLFQGFSGLGLVVGVAAIGVLSVRAVVERRQSIGVLRAIGFRSSMIRTQFLIEASFITFLGVVVGIGLGILQSWLIFLEISKELEGAQFNIPIGDIGILICITIIASILASVIPANEASKTYPAEAIRYE